MNIIPQPSTLATQVVDAIRSVVGSDSAVLHEPRFNGNEWKYLKECLDSTFVSSVGKFVGRFESDLADYTRVNHVVAVVNGTSALHIALQLAGVKTDDEVLIPAMTFVATANAVRYCGATPHFVDSEERTLGVDPQALREYLQDVTETRKGQCFNKTTGRVIRAIVPMHTFGHPVDIDGVLAVAQDFHLVLVEDAAESLGSTYQGSHMGTFGLVGALSFNGNKVITTGGGGAIITNDSVLAKHAKHLTTTAKVPHRWDYVHDRTGYNYRLPNINAALGCAQLELLPSFLEEKRRLYECYQKAFAKISQLLIFSEPKDCRSNYWLQTLMLDDFSADQKDAILAATNDAGLQTRPVWMLMHHLDPYLDCPKMELPVAESLSQRLINLPSSVHMEIEGVR
ncbi:MAG: aminotransferase DegT [Nitrosomonadaceae bacterium]|nr:aminotransferase DegT [Nitrosomonadaceae bacterium]